VAWHVEACNLRKVTCCTSHF